MDGKVKFAFALSAAALAAVCLASLCFGSADLGVGKILKCLFAPDGSIDSTIVWSLRMPRIAAAIIVGASLALAGCGLQCIFRNPLAEPSITGISAGASLGAVISIMFMPAFLPLEVLAFICALLASSAVCALGSEGGKVNPQMTILAGVAVNALCGAMVGLFMYATRESGLKSFVFWSMGSFDKCDWRDVAVCACISIPAWAVIASQYKNLNAMLLGDRQAFDVGVNVRRTQILVVVAAVAMTAAGVAMCGTIGFVGLMIPHIARTICGAGNGRVMPMSIILGAGLAVASDLGARAIAPENPIPIGVITAILGAPFFAAILRKSKRNA